MNRFEDVRTRLSEELGIPPEKITMETHLFDDLHADSMDLMNLVSDIQDDYNIEFDDNSLRSIKTVADIVSFVTKQLGE